MTDISQLSERDLLVRIDTRLESMEPRLAAAEKDILELKLANARARSFFGGAKALWGVMAGLPIGVVAFLMGDKVGG